MTGYVIEGARKGGAGRMRSLNTHGTTTTERSKFEKPPRLVAPTDSNPCLVAVSFRQQYPMDLGTPIHRKDTRLKHAAVNRSVGPLLGVRFHDAAVCIKKA